ncbi:hypothetical protein [Methylobacterium sp. J-076]|uniref:hypothetical protein n=1 Tax=Methylobacterium sp. J-076 TaxID=2836655 RepID=UPI001FBBF74D|nr:hypothetical protein [Methylobacterium sp. J-076]MCJ2015201.1 hypothetical protein [Methylobacterium sp. J-076]
MRGRKSQSRFEDASPVEAEDGRGPVVIALMAAAISGFFVGLVIQGEAAFAVAMAVVVPATGCAGWWLHRAFAQDELRAGP